MDEKDELLLSLLQQNGRMSNADLARALEMTPSATLERVRKLEEKGLIKGYTALLDAPALDLKLLAFIFMRVDEQQDETDTAQKLAQLPFVQELHHLAGEDCFILKVRARDTDDLYRILKDEFGTFKSIRATRTSIVLHTEKETQALPVTGKRRVKA